MTGRNSDIWTSFVICKLVEHTGDVVMYGSPFVKQFRNPHNLWQDLEDELENNKATETFVSLLNSIQLKDGLYKNLLDELINKSLKKITEMDHIKGEHLDMMQNYFKQYKVWSDSFE